MVKKSIIGYLKFSHRFSIVLFVVFISLFVTGLWFVKNNFKVNTDLAALFDGDNESVQRLKEVGKRIGSFEMILKKTSLSWINFMKRSKTQSLLNL